MASPGAPGDEELNDSCFARNDDEARERYDKYKSRDPFPDIKPALLNSADIYDYVAATGMIFPFYPDEERLKPASYGLALMGPCLYWDAKGKERKCEIEAGKPFMLERDSIVFVTLEPMFRVPDYMALRFNLKIEYVYRGLLVGTGPLVDPGFEGKLSLPLHNLTTNDYELEGGEILVWLEFTKVGDNKRWLDGPREDTHRKGRYIPFPSRKKGLTLRNYLTQAAPNRSIRSSIPPALEDSRRALQDATQATIETRQGIVEAREAVRRGIEGATTKLDEEVREMREEMRHQLARLRRLGYGALVVGALALIALVYAGYDLSVQSIDAMSSARDEIHLFQRQRLDDKNTIQSLQREFHNLRGRIEQLELETAPLDEVMESSSPRPQTR